MNKSLFFLHKLIATFTFCIILVSFTAPKSIAEPKTEQRRAACVLVDFDGRVRSTGRCNVNIATSNSGVKFDIEWDGSTSTQFSLNQFPSDGTYRINTNDGNATMQVEKQGSVFIIRGDRGFRGRIIFP
ncbi:MAG: hypothetical protein F6K17_21790 [Okeania sp. SIO3C4]|nr:hypothetical protein [Okeania sp. SIO3B3]NER05038.1 hypothetical protein [Okeania sp. SIO3C4]